MPEGTEFWSRSGVATVGACRSCRTRRTGPGCSSGCAPSAASTPPTSSATPSPAASPPPPMAWRGILERPDVGDRPDDSTWSPLEYACHVRDVHRVYAGRVGRMLAEDDPHYENWDQDATAIEDALRGAGPGERRRRAGGGGRGVGTLFASVPGDGWERTGRRSDGAPSRSTPSPATTSTTSSTTSGTSPDHCPRCPEPSRQARRRSPGG